MRSFRVRKRTGRGDRRAWEEWAEEEEQISAACPVVGPAEALKIGAHARLQAVL